MRGTVIVLLTTLALLFILVAGCEETFQVSLEADPQEGGEVIGEGEYSSETEVIVEAEPVQGYSFREWKEDGETVSQEKTYEFIMEEDRDLVAVFQEKTVEVLLYFCCAEAVETGEVGEYGYATPVSREIAEPEATEEWLEATLVALIEGPTLEEEEEKGVLPVVHDHLEVLEVEIEEGVATVNLSEEMFGEEWDGGTTSAQVFIDGFVHTATQFPEVDKLLVQVEGEVWSEGHFYWDQPWYPEKTTQDAIIGEKVQYEGQVEGLAGEIIKILDRDDQVIFEYSHGEFVEWAEDHWEQIFEEVPAFHPEQPIYPQDLSYFEDTAALCPDGKMFAFSVHDYYAATHMSFVGVVDLETGEVDLVDQENRGQIEKFHWSPEGSYLAYALNTAEAGGYFLSNDHINEMTKGFTLDGEELGEELNSQTFFPSFRNLSWEEDESRLEFVSDAPEEAEEIEWSVDPYGEDLVKEDIR